MDELIPHNPLTGEPLPAVPVAGPDEVAAAVDRARRAFGEWSAVEPAERRPYLRALRRAIADNVDRIGDTIRAETGKDRGETMHAELLASVLHARYVAKAAPRVLKRRRVSSFPAYHKSAWVEYHPRGVAAVIGPWNYPFLLPFQPTVTALAAGCTVVLKPSEVTPHSGELIAELVTEAGFPPGAVEVVHGAADTGRALIDSGVDIVSFTGSSATARKVAAQAAQHLIPLVMELGGSDAMIVLEDADLTRAARGAVWGACFNAGQNCIAVERVYVVEEVYGQFLSEIDEAIGAVEASSDPKRGIGPIIDPEQFKVIERHIDDAVAGGARLVHGGRREGPFFQPTVLVDVDQSSALMHEETFGPVLPIVKVADEEQALRFANDTPYGLHGSVWTGDAVRGRRLASRMHTGTVAVNDALVNYAIPALPFGGIGDSGYGSHTGPEGLMAYCWPKAITDSRITPRRELQWFPRLGGVRPRRRLLKLLSRL